MIKRLSQPLLSIPRRAVTAVSSIWQRRDGNGRVGLPGGNWYSARRLSATIRKTWRVWAKVVMIAIGLGLFLAMEYALAVAINAEQWYLVVAIVVGGICLAAVAAKPSAAFIAWLIVSPVAGIYLRLGKMGDLPQITFDRVVIYTLALVLLVRCLGRKETPGKLILPEYLWLAFPVYMLLSIPFFPHEAPQRTALQFMQRIGDPLVVYFIAKAAMSERKHVLAVVAGLLTVGIYSSAMAMYDHFTGRMSLAAISGVEASLYYADAGGRAAGPFLSPMALGIMLGVAIPLAINYSEWTKRTGAKLFYYLCILVMAVGWFFTYTRGAYLVLISAMLLMPLLAARCRKRYSVVFVALAIIAVIGVPVVMTQKGVAYRLTQDNTAKQRVVLAQTLVNLIRAHPWFGVGLGNYRSQMPNYIAGDPMTMKYVWTGGSRSSLPQLVSSHNTYLTIMSDHGLVGFALYIGSFLGFGLYIMRIRKRLPPDDFLGRDLASLVVSIMVGYVLSLNTTSMEGRDYVNFVIWILVAAVVRLAQMAKDKAVASADDLTAQTQRELAV